MNTNEHVQMSAQKLEQLIREVIKDSLAGYQGLMGEEGPLDFINREEAIRLLKISPSTLHNWSRQGKVRPYGIGGRVYFRRSEIEQSMIPLMNSKN
jgi:hypothetical protein